LVKKNIVLDGIDQTDIDIETKVNIKNKILGMFHNE